MRADVYGLVLGTLIPLMPVVACSGDSAGSLNGPSPPQGPEACVPLTFLGSLSDSHSVAWAINNSRLVAGTTLDPETLQWRAFRWDGREMTLIAPTFGTRSAGSRRRFQ